MSVLKKTKAPEQRYESLQLLRFLAALMVVIAHGTQAYSLRVRGSDGSDYWHLGTIGVDIFFVISGCMMALTTRHAEAGGAAAWSFIVKRAIRIVPIYWIFTALKLLVALAVPAASLKAMPTADHIAASLLFIPHESAQGEFWPVLPVGWTLNFEMFFYVAFAAILAIDAHRLLGVMLLFASMTAIGKLDFSPDFFHFYLDSLLFEFLFGMVLAGLAASPRRAQMTGWKNVFLSALLCCVALLFLVFGDPLPRGLSWGIPAACLVCLALLWEEHVRGCRLLHPAVRAGDSSYSLYLTHTFTVPAAVIIAGKFMEANQTVTVLFAAITSVMVAEVTYRLLERPLLRAISRRFTRN